MLFPKTMSHDAIQRLNEKKLLLITGKGGSGKSTIALALAHRFSSLGKKVWLVEMGRRRDKNFSRLPELLGEKNLFQEPKEVKFGGQKFFASHLDPTLCLAEYVDIKLPTAGLAGILLNNKVTSSLLEIVPGLPELVTLGKLWYAATNPKSNFKPDLILIDGPASGHAIAMLRAPENFQKLTKAGPLYRDSSAMVDFLQDKLCSALLTSLPEEMSLQESLETEELLRKNTSVPTIFLNKLFPDLGKTNKGDSPLQKAENYLANRYKREQMALKEFSFPAPKIEIPYLFAEDKSLAQKISEQWA